MPMQSKHILQANVQEKFIRIKHAYNTLLNSESQFKYDYSNHNSASERNKNYSSQEEEFYGLETTPLKAAKLFKNGRCAFFFGNRCTSSAAAVDEIPQNSSSSTFSSDDDNRREDVHSRFSNAVTSLFRPFHSSNLQSGTKPDLPHSLAYNKMMKAFGQAGQVEEVLRLFHEMKQSKCSLNVLCYNTVINALAMAHRSKEAQQVFDEMISAGVVPNVSSFNILVKLHSCCCEQFDMAYEVIRTMRTCGYLPDWITYVTLITGLCRARRIEEAWRVLDWMEEKCAPTVHTYTPIVQVYCMEGKIEAAKTLMATMERIGCPPSIVTYNIVIDGLCKIGHFDEVREILRECGLKGLRPTSVTYNTFMDGLLKAGKTKEAFEQLGVMVENGLTPTVVTRNILLGYLWHDSKIWEVDVVGYNTVMARLCKSGRWLDCLTLLACMLKKGVNPNTRTFNVVINSLCKGGKLRKAKCIFNNGQFVANVVTYNTLIHCFFLKGKISEVHSLYSSMIEKIVPDVITYTIMSIGHYREGMFFEATDFFLRSLDGRWDQELVVGLINKLVKRRRFRELLYLFEGMVRKGRVLDDFIFCSSIKAFCKQGCCQSAEIYNVSLILDMMLKMHWLFAG